MSTSGTAAPATVVITGAAARNGIGYATARRMAEEGWALALLDLDGEAARTAAAELASAHGVAAWGGEVDVRDESSVREAVAAIGEAGLPEIAALANIAGIPSPRPFWELTLEEWERVIGVNLTGTFLMTREVLPFLMERRGGSVVNMSSVSAQQGGGVFSKTSYSAAKAGVLGLTRSLAREVAEYGITVNAIAPGVVDTGIRDAGTDPENEERLTAAVPLGRQGDPGEIAALVSFLCGTDSRYITGGTHNINGGAYIA